MKQSSKYFAALMLCACSQLSLAGVVVIVNKGSSVDSLNAEQVSDIFMKKATSFPDGSQVEPVDQAEDQADRDQFYELVAGKNSRQMKSYWSKLVFSGKAQPPKEVGAGSDVLSAVAGNPGTIGYIDSARVDASVKVVLTAE